MTITRHQSLVQGLSSMYEYVSFAKCIANSPQLQKNTDDCHRRPLRALEPPEDWQPTITKIVSEATLDKPATILICGPKASGKSTICRLMKNALLTTQRSQSRPPETSRRVILLDLDPGQPEFSPPGEISLIDMRSCNLGTPFTHPIVPHLNGSQLLRSHHFGSVSPREDPKHYFDCVLDLLRYYRRLSNLDPAYTLVINCSGWIQGSGLDLSLQLLSFSDATDVIYTSTTGPDGIDDVLATACNVRGSLLHRVSSQPFQDVTSSASKLRSMQTLSYFHLAEPEAGNLRWNPSPLTDRPPLIIPYVGPQQAIFAVMILGDEQNPEFFVSILDGSLVGIVLIEDDDAIPRARGAHVSSSSNGTTEKIDNRYVDQPDVEPDHLHHFDSPDRDSRSSSPRLSNSMLQPYMQHSLSADAPEHQKHSSIHRSSLGIPYLASINQRTAALSPSHTRSLGQAMIRSIDKESHTFHLLTPIPEIELQSLHQQKRKIVLVRGKLDPPTWAYKEDLENERSRRRRQMKVLGDIQDDPMNEREEKETRGWAENQSWVSIAEAKRKESAKVRRVRRDIRYRGHADGSEQASQR